MLLITIKLFLMGLLGSLAMLVFIEFLSIFIVLPFNVLPSGAFLAKLGIYSVLGESLLYFFYGSCVGALFGYVFKNHGDIKKGIYYSIALWLFFMVAIGPFMDWGIFGFGADAAALSETNIRHLGDPVKYMVITFFNHLIFGITIGIINKAWKPVEYKQNKPGKFSESGTEGV